MTTKQISRLVWSNWPNGRKMEDNFATCYTPAQYWINKTFLQTKRSRSWVTEFCDGEVDLIKWWLNFVSCNFGLKSQLWLDSLLLSSGEKKGRIYWSKLGLDSLCRTQCFCLCRACDKTELKNFSPFLSYLLTWNFRNRWYKQASCRTHVTHEHNMWSSWSKNSF